MVIIAAIVCLVVVGVFAIASWRSRSPNAVRLTINTEGCANAGVVTVFGHDWDGGLVPAGWYQGVSIGNNQAANIHTGVFRRTGAETAVFTADAGGSVQFIEVTPGHQAFGLDCGLRP